MTSKEPRKEPSAPTPLSKCGAIGAATAACLLELWIERKTELMIDEVDYLWGILESLTDEVLDQYTNRFGKNEL